MAAPMDSGKIPEKTMKDADGGSEGNMNGNRKKAMFFSAVGVSILMGFGYTMYRIKKKDPVYFQQILKPTQDVPEAGVSVASKALGIATVISVTSMGLLTWGTFKVLGVHNAKEFHAKLLEYFPAKKATGRSEFKNLYELADYLESEDRKADLQKKREQKS